MAQASMKSAQLEAIYLNIGPIPVIERANVESGSPMLYVRKC